MSKLAHSHEPSMLRIDIDAAIKEGNADLIAEHIEHLQSIYQSAVEGRRDFRAAYNLTRVALGECLSAMNPSDRKGISLHEWNERLKATTTRSQKAFDWSKEDTDRIDRETRKNPSGPLRVRGVGRMADDHRAVLVALSGLPTDDELRDFHEYIRTWRATIKQGE